jgi:hypothetical protein
MHFRDRLAHLSGLAASLQTKPHLHFRLHRDLSQTDRPVITGRLIAARRVLHHILHLCLIPPALPRIAVVRPAILIDTEHAAWLRIGRARQIARFLLCGLHRQHAGFIGG